MSAQLSTIIQFLEPKTQDWLKGICQNTSIQELKIGFVMAHRLIPKEPLNQTDLGGNQDLLSYARFLILEAIQKLDEREFPKTLEFLFDQGEIQEARAILMGLSNFKQPENLVEIGKKAVRSNTGVIFDAFAFDNPYAERYFDENAWNQLVLKCIFNLKSIHRIQGLRERANQNLASILSDFAHERWAAGRRVPAQVWVLTIDFLNEQLLNDIEKLILEGELEDKIAGYLVLRESRFLPAQELFTNLDFPDERSNWNWELLNY